MVRVCAEAAIAAARQKAATKREETSLNLLTIVSERFRRNEEGGFTLAWNAATHYVECETQVSMCRILQPRATPRQCWKSGSLWPPVHCGMTSCRRFYSCSSGPPGRLAKHPDYTQRPQVLCVGAPFWPIRIHFWI